VQPQLPWVGGGGDPCLLCCSAMLAIAIVAEKLGLSRLKRSITAFA